MSCLDGNNWCAWCLEDDRRRRLGRNKQNVRYRNMLIAATGTYLFICILLTTVLYAARRSMTVLLFNGIQGFFVGLAGVTTCRAWFVGMLAAFGGYASVTGIILLYALLITALQGDGAFLLLHGSMIVAMDGPYLLIYSKTVYVLYKEYYKQPAVGPHQIADNSNVVIVYLDSPSAGNHRTSNYNSQGQQQQEIASSGTAPSAPIGTGNNPATLQNTVVGQPAGNFHDPAVAGAVAAIGPRSTSPQGGGNQVAVLRQQNSNSSPVVIPEGEYPCPICLINRRNVAMVPCGHLCCSSCQPQIHSAPRVECPLCRTPIRGFQKLFL
ncbi:unnamed protein product [Amoebophrya sp. A120]|nr:unnamed protein product [Amoebophrya sp. A120]|eukprot:GSA120T00002729001.1